MKKEERLALIRRVAKKIELEKKGKYALAAAINTRTRKQVSNKLEKIADSIDDSLNINAWSDADKFAREAVSDVYSETTRFDNEWN
jgi:hypothetical protein